VKATRRSFIDRDLLYLFSFDTNLDGGREEIGFVPGGARVNVFSQAKDSRVFQVLGERVSDDVQPLSGTIVEGGDWPFLREDIDIGTVDVRVVIRTDDRPAEIIHASWGGVFPIGVGGFRKLTSERPKLGDENDPARATIVIEPRFETAVNSKYRWLMDYQCIGFGRIDIVKSRVRRSTVDVYAMD
jgi:hypothetical protein